jgi:hypothetical protein
MTYGGNEEILKGGKGARRSPRAGKTVRLRRKKCLWQRSSGILCQNTGFLLRLNGNICGSS